VGRAWPSAPAEILHLGYGLVGGALLTLIAPHIPDPHAGAIFGLAVWAVSSVGLAPITRLVPPPWRSGLPENMINGLAHRVVTALMLGALERQPELRANPAAERQRARVA
jgi:uncharacterized membrane protein YagU involved in acid resistance